MRQLTTGATATTMQTNAVAIEDNDKRNVSIFGGRGKKCLDDLEEMGSPDPSKKSEP